MRKSHKSPLALVAAGLFVVGCQPVTEELPVRPNPVFSVPPIVVVPVPVPTPANPTPPPSNPNPTPPPQNPNPTPPPSDPGGGDVPDNTNPVAKVTAKLYFVECQGQISSQVDPIPVGCRVHLDATPTDANNKHTRAKGNPSWTYTGNTGSVRVGGNSGYNPVLDVLAPGSVTAYCSIDAVRSNDVNLNFR